MRIWEILEPNAYYDLQTDTISAREFGDTRKPKLTLMYLNRLKKSRRIGDAFHRERLAFLPTMYAVDSVEDQMDKADLAKKMAEVEKLRLQNLEKEYEIAGKRQEQLQASQGYVRKAAVDVSRDAVRRRKLA